MIDRIDFQIDLMQSDVMVPMTLIGYWHNAVSVTIEYVGRTDEGEVFKFPGVEGFRAIGRLRPELMTDSMSGGPMSINSHRFPATGIEGNPSYYSVDKVVINPSKFPNLNRARDFVHGVLNEFSGDPQDSLPWGLRVSRIELAIDLPLEFREVYKRLFIPNIRTREFRRDQGSNTVEVVWGASPIRVASYDRKERLEMLGETVSGPLTRLEKRFTEARYWRTDDSDNESPSKIQRFPHREIQSLDWIINMCADIEEGIFRPFEGIELKNVRLPETNEVLQAAEERMLRARSLAERRRLLPAYRQALSRMIEVQTMLNENGYLWTHQCINSRYGPRNQETGDHRLLTEYQNLLSSCVQADGEGVALGELLKESIRRHHFNNEAPERVDIPTVPERRWIRDQTEAAERDGNYYLE